MTEVPLAPTCANPRQPAPTEAFPRCKGAWPPGLPSLCIRAWALRPGQRCMPMQLPMRFPMRLPLPLPLPDRTTACSCLPPGQRAYQEPLPCRIAWTLGASSPPPQSPRDAAVTMPSCESSAAACACHRTAGAARWARLLGDASPSAAALMAKLKITVRAHRSTLLLDLLRASGLRAAVAYPYSFAFQAARLACCSCPAPLWGRGAKVYLPRAPSLAGSAW